MNPGTVLLLGLLVLLYLNFVGRRRATRERDAVQSRVVPGSEVVTTSGLHATVSEVHDDGTVTLLTGPGQLSRWERPAVGRVLSSPSDEVPAETPTEAVTGAASPDEVEPPARLAAGATAVDAAPSGATELRDDVQDTAPPHRA